MSPRPQYLSADERRAVTVETVLALAAERNPNDITTSAIAERMGVTQGALFRHFPSKDAILDAVMQWVADRLLGALDAAAARAATPLEALEAMFMANLGFVAEHPGVPRMMFGELQHAAMTPKKRMAATLIRRYRERLATVIEQGKAAGQIAVDLDTDAAATLFIGTIQGLVMQALLADDPDHLRAEGPRAYAIYRRGIAAR
jgi:AcrR family transcriptional regulator